MRKSVHCIRLKEVRGPKKGRVLKYNVRDSWRLWTLSALCCHSSHLFTSRGSIRLLPKTSANVCPKLTSERTCRSFTSGASRHAAQIAGTGSGRRVQWPNTSLHVVGGGRPWSAESSFTHRGLRVKVETYKARTHSAWLRLCTSAWHTVTPTHREVSHFKAAAYVLQLLRKPICWLSRLQKWNEGRTATAK
jgi:hypothetical protein